MIKIFYSFLKSNKLILFFSLLVTAIHLYSNIFANYGIFRDEFYYIACSNRLDLGYVDHPPFSIFILKIILTIFGDSLFAIRLLPLLLSGYIVFMTSLLTKSMGGNKLSIITSAIIVILCPLILNFTTFYSMNSISIALWVTAYYVLNIILTEQKPYWIYLGVIIGIGLLNKIDFLWFGAGLFFALLLTENRAFLKTKYPYITCLIAFIIFSPYILWNILNDFPHIEFMSNALKFKYKSLDQINFIKNLIMSMNPITIIIWLPGIFYFFINKDRKKYRPLAIIFLTTAAILLINGSSNVAYLTAAFFPIISSGSILLEHVANKKFMRWTFYTSNFSIILCGIIILPLSLPILPPQKYIEHTNTLGITASSSENKKLSEMPQFFADMFGWEELAQNVSTVYKLIPNDEKNKTIIFCSNYGEAGALEYYSSKHELPIVISFHNNYWLWAKKELPKDFENVIVLGDSKTNLLHDFEEVELILTHTAKYSMPYENNLPIFLCKKPKYKSDDFIGNSKNKNYI